MSFCLLFAHQCNSTVTLISVMKRLIEGDMTSNNHMSFYRKLSKECCILKQLNIDKSTDVGSGIYPRYQSSNNKVMSEITVNNHVDFLSFTFDLYRKRMQCLSKNKLREKFVLFDSLKEDIKNSVSGLGDIRSIHLIQLASLVGLIPLDYYVYVPMHMSGGPKTFLEDDMNIEKYLCNLDGTNLSEKVVSWTIQEMDQLQKLFTTEYTPNMNENCSCIIARKSSKHDVFYYLPWYDHKIRKLLPNQLQLMFRINGRGKNDFVLEAYDGKR